MIVGVCLLTLRLHATHSLKEKRSVVKGLLTRMQNQLNASVSEVDAHDVWGKAVIALSTVSLSEGVVRGIFRQAETLAERAPGVELIDVSVSLR